MSMLYPFVELEFVHAIGPAAGRHVVALSDQADQHLGDGSTPEDVLQIQIVEGATTSRGLRRRTKDATRADPRSVRVGYGEARPLTQGRWTEAFLAPPPRAPRVDRVVGLGSSETVALVLCARHERGRGRC